MQETDEPALGKLSTVFACPVCGAAMFVAQRTNMQLLCASTHAFDVSRAGHVNLLLTNQRRSSRPGYSKEMLQSRRALAQLGLFDPLLQLVARLVVGEVASRPLLTPPVLLDAGCGEGYFLSRLLSSVNSRGGLAVQGVGVDISKEAMQLASKLDRTVVWCVMNTARRLPLVTGAFSVVMNVLAPMNLHEFRRILEPSGVLIKVVPQQGHLEELRDRLYERPPKRTDDPVRKTIAHLSSAFRVIQEHRLRWTCCVAPGSVHDLVMMNPLFWKAKRTRLEALQHEGLSAITMDLHVLLAKPEAPCQA